MKFKTVCRIAGALGLCVGLSLGALLFYGCSKIPTPYGDLIYLSIAGIILVYAFINRKEAVKHLKGTWKGSTNA